MRGIAFVFALAMLGGCAAGRLGNQPVAEVGQPDTYRFKIYVNAFTTEAFAWEKLQPDIESYRKANGYGSYTVANRFYGQGGYYEYSVRFAR